MNLPPLPEFLTLETDGWLHVTGHRIGIKDIVHDYSKGMSAEDLVVQFPTLTLATIHKVLAFYLENRPLLDEFVRAEDEACEQMRAAATTHGPTLEELRARREKRRVRAG